MGIFKLFEDNKSLDDLIKHLDSLILKLRKNKKIDLNNPFIKELINFYSSTIANFYGDYILRNKEIDKTSEETIFNSILDIINILAKIK